VKGARTVLVAALLWSGTTHASGAASDCGARLSWIDGQLVTTAQRARVWSWGWGIGLGALTIASLAAVPFVDRPDRVDYYVGAATSFVGLVPLVVLPLTVMDDAKVLHAKVSASADCADLLREAETILAGNAANQAEGRSWWMHVANIVVNGGAGLFLGLAYDHWPSAVVTGVLGTAVGEAMISTQPIDSITDLARYQRGEWEGWRLQVSPVVAQGRLGITVVASF
jgi:hypothetical protein